MTTYAATATPPRSSKGGGGTRRSPPGSPPGSPQRRISKLTKAELARREAERKKQREEFLWHIRSQGAVVSHRALHAFRPEQADYGETKNTAEDLLSFEAGALIEVTWSEDRFWWCGFVKGREDKKAFFPADFVEPADMSQKSTPRPTQRTKSTRVTELRSAVSLPRTPALPVDLFSGGWWTSKEDWELTQEETQELAEYRTDSASDSDDDELLNEGVPPPRFERPQNAALSAAGRRTRVSSRKSPTQTQAGASWSKDNPFGDAVSDQPFQSLAAPDVAPRHPDPDLPATDDATGDPSSVRGQMGLKTPEEKAEEEERKALYRTTEQRRLDIISSQAEGILVEGHPQAMCNGVYTFKSKDEKGWLRMQNANKILLYIGDSEICWYFDTRYEPQSIQGCAYFWSWNASEVFGHFCEALQGQADAGGDSITKEITSIKCWQNGAWVEGNLRFQLLATTEDVAAVEEAGRAGPFANQVELTDPDLRGLADGEDVVQARARAEAHATTLNKKKQGRKASGCRGCWCGGKTAGGAD
jgi:hypothetical protein